jgi:membrane-bound lytic murein transglycosylase B
MLKFILCLLFTALFSLHANNTKVLNLQPSFNDLLLKIRTEALSKGISEKTIDEALNNIVIDEKVLENFLNQAEFILNFWSYTNSRVNDYRITKGKEAWLENKEILKKIFDEYGVNPAILVAFWGLETNYSRNFGNLNAIRSLVTLSFNQRRSEFFFNELIILLKLIDEGKIPLEVKGSWAGALGSMQFLPSNIMQYGIDKNNDNKIDLWNNKEDIFASASNFLLSIGWNKGERWGREVTIPKRFDYKLSGLKIKKSINEWSLIGIKNAKGEDLPKSEIKASLLMPMGHKGPAFLVYNNFHTILKWNNSILYALSVGYLSDILINSVKLTSKPIIEPSLSKEDVLFIQTKLNHLGFDSGEPDGISGPKTRGATRSYQKNNNLPVDGYVGYELLQRFKNLEQ